MFKFCGIFCDMIRILIFGIMLDMVELSVFECEVLNVVKGFVFVVVLVIGKGLCEMF